MTGFGQAQGETPLRRVSVTVQTVNHRHLDVVLRWRHCGIVVGAVGWRRGDVPVTVAMGPWHLLTGAIAALVASLLILMAARASLAMIVGGLAVFFCAFNLLEASLPSMVSRFAPRGSRGAAIGVYSGMQYLGMFAGGASGGLLLKHAGPAAVYGFGAALAALWLVAVATMANPPAAAESTLSMGRT